MISNSKSPPTCTVIKSVHNEEAGASQCPERKLTINMGASSAADNRRSRGCVPQSAAAAHALNLAD